MKKVVLLIVLLLPSLFCRGIYFPNLMGELMEIDGIYYLIQPNYELGTGYGYACIPELPDGVKVLADYEGDITIRDSVYYEGIYYPVISIYPYAFCGFSNLRSVVIPSTVKTMGKLAFYHCRKLSHVVISDGITAIENGTFSYSGIKSVDLPQSVTTIKDAAFSYCDSLVTVQWPENITEMGQQVFQRCKNLTTVILPAHLKIIRNEAFDGCTSLSTVVLPAELSAIHSRSFRGCSSLTSIEWPENLETIGSEAFSSTSLTSLRLPDHVNYISSGAFACPIKTAVLGTGLRWMAPNIFGTGAALTDLYCCAETPPQLEPSYDGARYSLFSSDLQKRVVLHVPASAIDLYKTDRMWKDFATILPINDIPDGISEMDANPLQTSNLSSDDVNYYDLQGRRLTGKPAKGIYIQNGRKVLVK